MAIYRTPAEMQRALSKKADALRKTVIRTPSKAATFLQATAIKLAGVKSGETIRGIKKTKGKKGYIVVSRVSPKGTKGFRQNLWMNRTAPHRSISVRWAKPKGKKIVYGDGSHMITGTPRFFHIATLRAWDKFKELARMNTRKALRVGA